MNEEILSVKNICKRFGAVQALANVDLIINKGEIHCLVGENGSGKSTLIKIISGVEDPDSGEIYIDGKLQKETYRNAVNERRHPGNLSGSGIVS